MTPGPLLFRRTFGPLLVLAIGAGVVAAMVAAKIRPGVEVSLSFTVPLPATIGEAGIGRTARLEDGGAQAVRAAEIFAETLVGWLGSPDVVSVAYERAGVPFPHPSVRRLSRAFTARRIGGQVVIVDFRAISSEEGERLAAAVVSEVEARTSALNAHAQDVVFRPGTAKPLIVSVEYSPLVRGAVTALVVGVLGYSLILLWDFLRSPPLDSRQ